MNVAIPPELQQAVVDHAARYRLTVDEFVREAIIGRMRIEKELMDELDAWQEVRDEALRLVEDSIE